MKKSIFLLILNFSHVYGASYDTLPKSVNMLAIKQVMTSSISSKYNADDKKEQLELQENFTAKNLELISSAMKTYFDELKKNIS